MNDTYTEIIKWTASATQIIKMPMPIDKKHRCLNHLLDRAGEELGIRDYTDLRDTIDAYLWEMIKN